MYFRLTTRIHQLFRPRKTQKRQQIAIFNMQETHTNRHYIMQ
jgi:hypothetical protein